MVVQLVAVMMCLFCMELVASKCENLDEANCSRLVAESHNTCDRFFGGGLCQKACGMCNEKDDTSECQDAMYCMATVNGDLFLGRHEDYRRSKETGIFVIGTYGGSDDCRFRLSIDKSQESDRIQSIQLEFGNRADDTDDYSKTILVDQISRTISVSNGVNSSPVIQFPHTVSTQQQSSGILVTIDEFSAIVKGWRISCESCCWSLIVKIPKLTNDLQEISCYLEYPSTGHLALTGPCLYQPDCVASR